VDWLSLGNVEKPDGFQAVHRARHVVPDRMRIDTISPSQQGDDGIQRQCRIYEPPHVTGCLVENEYFRLPWAEQRETALNFLLQDSGYARPNRPL
jgi:hypothetical protein